MKPRIVTIKDVAKRAGVSAATVSNVLSGDKLVRASSREKVLSAVSELNYRINPAASYLRRGRSRIIAAVVPSLENPFFTAIIAVVERLCRQDGYELIVSSSGEDPGVEATRIDALLNWKPAGFIILPCTADLPARDRIEAAKVPFVIADRTPNGPPCDLVEIDNVAAGAAAARHLVLLGHRRIAVCAPVLEVGNIRERIAGAVQAVAEAGAEPPIEVPTGTGSIVEPLPDGSEEALAQVTAVLALTNLSTLQTLAALTRAGRSVPAEVSLVGFDDYPWMAVARPSITAVRQPVGAIGGSIWSRLQDRIGGVDDPPLHRKHPTELILRESTAPLSPGGRPGLAG